MAKLTYETTMSLDGCTTGPDIDLENPLGVGGERLHQWIFGLASWREGATGRARRRDRARRRSDRRSRWPPTAR